MRDDTRIVTTGRDPQCCDGMVNMPIYRTSTVLFPTVDAYESARTHSGITYGRAGTPTTYALEEAMAELESGHRAVVVASGKAAVVLSLMAFLKSGDHVLVVDSTYGPTRHFCTRVLIDYGIETTFYDPAIGAGIAGLIRPNTRVVFLEAPGSLTFEMQDVPAITDAARAAGVVTMMDNTWATSLLFKPLAHGVDISINAATKYITGHSDVMMGIVTSTREVHEQLRNGLYNFGAPASPADCYLALRGLRTLSVRLARHQESALKVAEWLNRQDDVERVLYPALPGDPGHDLWRRDFKGASGLFGVILRPCAKQAVTAMVDGLELFGIGSSWGGFESLAIVTYPARSRTATSWPYAGFSLRLHVGLEDPDDLIADLDAGFARLRAAS